MVVRSAVQVGSAAGSGVPDEGGVGAGVSSTAGDGPGIGVAAGAGVAAGNGVVVGIGTGSAVTAGFAFGVGVSAGAVAGGEVGGGDVPAVVGDAVDASSVTACDVQPDTTIVRQRVKTSPAITLALDRHMVTMGANSGPTGLNLSRGSYGTPLVPAPPHPAPGLSPGREAPVAPVRGPASSVQPMPEQWAFLRWPYRGYGHRSLFRGLCRILTAPALLLSRWVSALLRRGSSGSYPSPSCSRSPSPSPLRHTLRCCRAPSSSCCPG